ncbi:MAG: dephospho-CoA kinase [Synergistaceae bacterium]|nr:dephospho-CoA kinase [Synergistaceae bacterium]
MAITGDVGAGKSTLAGIWASLGANVINADEIAKSQWSKPETLAAAVGRWGEGVVKDGAADFSAIARRAFGDEEEYRFMNSLIHPGAKADIRRLSASLRGLVVQEIPLLFETGGGHDWADYIVYVAASGDVKASRNAGRGWDESEVSRRERFMMDSGEKKKKSDLVLCNNGDMESWEGTARDLGLKLMAMSSVCEISTCCGSLEDAEKISSLLVEKHLAACVNISEVKSRYFWKGKVCWDSEWHLSCKTTELALKGAMALIRANHPYELPAITAAELFRSDYRTLEWIAVCCGGFSKGCAE